MNPMASQPNTNSRRLFFTAGAEHFQILSFTQKPDGSIYISAPDLAASKWLEVASGNSSELHITTLSSAGKLSVHGSGVAHVRAVDGGEAELRLVGNYLSSDDNQGLGLRHLVTLFSTQPTHLPTSPAHNRLTDCSIRAAELKPYVLVFWAVPALKNLTVNVTAAFHENDLESVPPESGFGAFALRTHAVVWFAYRTKHMGRWPANSHLCFHDGFRAPIIIGTGEGACRLEMRQPVYDIADSRLSISL